MAGYYIEEAVGDATIKRWVETGLPAEKRRYSLGEFVRACTDDEWSVIEEKAQLTTAVGRKARRLLRIWLIDGVDCNDPLTVSALNWLEANTPEWTAQRVAELIG